MQSSSGSASGVGSGAGAGAGSRIIIKATLGHTTKRLALHTPSLSLPDLCSALHALFRPSALLSASTTNLILRYVDADGDHVTIDSDTDLSLALDLAANPHSSTAHLRLLVNDKLNCPLPATLSNEIDAKGLSLAGRNVASLHASLLDVRSLLDKVLDALEKARDKDRNVKPLDSDDIANLLGKSSISEGATSPIVTGAATPTPQSPAQRPASTSVTAAAAYPPQVQQQQQQQQQQAAATSNSNAYPGYPPTTAALAAAPPTATTATSAPPTASSTYPPTATATAQPQPQPQPQQPQYTGQQQQQYMGQQPPAQQQYGQYPPTQQQQQPPSYPGYPPTSTSSSAAPGSTSAYARYPQQQQQQGTPAAPQQQMPTGGSVAGQQQQQQQPQAPPMGYPGYSVPTPGAGTTAAYGMPSAPGTGAGQQQGGYPGYAGMPGYGQQPQQPQQQQQQQMPGYAVPPTYGKPY